VEAICADCGAPVILRGDPVVIVRTCGHEKSGVKVTLGSVRLYGEADVARRNPEALKLVADANQR
jgi:hypothetical protein